MTKALLLALQRPPPDLATTAILPVHQQNIKHYRYLIKRAEAQARADIISVTTADKNLLLLAPKQEHPGTHDLEDDPRAIRIGEHTLVDMPDDRFFDWYAVTHHFPNATIYADGRIHFHKAFLPPSTTWVTKHAVTSDNLTQLLQLLT